MHAIATRPLPSRQRPPVRGGRLTTRVGAHAALATSPPRQTSSPPTVPCSRLPSGRRRRVRSLAAPRGESPSTASPPLVVRGDFSVAGEAAATSSGRRNVVLLCAAVALVCAVDRAAMSVAILPMSTEFGWGEAQQGAVASVFFLGYTMTNPLAGAAAARAGSRPGGADGPLRPSAKLLMASGVALWSLFTVLTPDAAFLAASLAESRGGGDPAAPLVSLGPVVLTALSPLLLCRFVMGLGEGVAFPTIQALVASWVPPEGKSRSLTLAYSGAQAGTVVALLTAPLLVATAAGWPLVFRVYGGLGFAWLALWLPLVPNEPPPEASGGVRAGGGVDSRAAPRRPPTARRLRRPPPPPPTSRGPTSSRIPPSSPSDWRT